MHSFTSATPRTASPSKRPVGIFAPVTQFETPNISQTIVEESKVEERKGYEVCFKSIDSNLVGQQVN